MQQAQACSYLHSRLSSAMPLPIVCACSVLRRITFAYPHIAAVISVTLAIFCICEHCRHSLHIGEILCSTCLAHVSTDTMR